MHQSVLTASGVTYTVSGNVVTLDGERYRMGPKNALIPLCEGTTRREPKDACEHNAVHGRPYCRLHGGHAVVGVESPNFTTGRYSAYVRHADLAGRMEHIRQDPELNSLRENLILVDARIGQLLEMVDGASIIPRWADARDAFHEYRAAYRSGDADTAMKRLAQLERLLDEGGSEEDVWHQIGQQTELRRRLAESEAKILEKLNWTFSIEEGVLFIRALVEISREFVPEDRMEEFGRRLRLLQAGMSSPRRKQK